MDGSLKAEIDSRLKTLCTLKDLLPPEGLASSERAAKEMGELISEKYEPYFSGNAALHILSACQRCGRCCRNERSISVAVSIDDCRRIAKHLSMSQKKFLMQYTRPHDLKGTNVGSARLIRKGEGEHCPFYDFSLPGCSIHKVKPQVCSAALYLSKMNLLLCRDSSRFSTFSQCPSDGALRARVEEFLIKINNDPEAKGELERIFRSDLPEVRLFRLLLRLKGMEIYFGREKAALLARKLGLKRIPSDEELGPVAFLYAVTLLGSEPNG